MTRKKKASRPSSGTPAKSKSKRTAPSDPPSLPPQMPPRFMMERAMAEMFGQSPTNPEFQAQQLAYDAMEAIEDGDDEQAISLAQAAVDLDPLCTDAAVILAQVASESKDELIENFERVVADAEQAFGAEFFVEHRGHFWGILETRPYMRARASLAELLAAAGRTDDAIDHYAALLDLNPNDNQGNRYVLLGLYLAADRREPAAALFEQYEGEWSAMFAWSRVLERWLNDDLDGARVALRKARKSNPHVERLLTGRQMPRESPGFYSPGDENEAIVCVQETGRAWQQHPESIAWLKRQS